MSLARNDIDGAMKVWMAHLRDGTLTYDVTHMLLRMQDDPDRLQRAMAEKVEDPTLAELAAKISIYPEDVGPMPWVDKKG